jgi:hypothetical protein
MLALYQKASAVQADTALVFLPFGQATGNESGGPFG